MGECKEEMSVKSRLRLYGMTMQNEESRRGKQERETRGYIYVFRLSLPTSHEVASQPALGLAHKRNM